MPPKPEKERILIRRITVGSNNRLTIPEDIRQLTGIEAGTLTEWRAVAAPSGLESFIVIKPIKEEVNTQRN